MALTTTLRLTVYLATCVCAQAVLAEPRWDRIASRNGPEVGYVVAESRFGHGTVAGPVRRVRTGYEVRMPGGTWIACRRSCAETLRVETVDFWENRGAGRNAIDTECGLLGCLTWSRRF